MGTAGLFLLQGAQFLGVATVVVYAGAIVVIFLFVLMLAQPGGRAHYDRIHWGWLPTGLAALAGAVLVTGVVFAISGITHTDPRGGSAPTAAVPATADRAARPGSEPDSQHVARLGGQLFARHLVGVELAGTLLLAALVGAAAITAQGKIPSTAGRTRP